MHRIVECENLDWKDCFWGKIALKGNLISTAVGFFFLFEDWVERRSIKVQTKYISFSPSGKRSIEPLHTSAPYSQQRLASRLLADIFGFVYQMTACVKLTEHHKHTDHEPSPQPDSCDRPLWESNTLYLNNETHKRRKVDLQREEKLPKELPAAAETTWRIQQMYSDCWVNNYWGLSADFDSWFIPRTDTPAPVSDCGFLLQQEPKKGA